MLELRRFVDSSSLSDKLQRVISIRLGSVETQDQAETRVAWYLRSVDGAAM